MITLGKEGGLSQKYLRRLNKHDINIVFVRTIVRICMRVLAKREGIRRLLASATPQPGSHLRCR